MVLLLLSKRLVVAVLVFPIGVISAFLPPSKPLFFFPFANERRRVEPVRTVDFADFVLALSETLQVTLEVRGVEAEEYEQFVGREPAGAGTVFFTGLRQN